MGRTKIQISKTQTKPKKMKLFYFGAAFLAVASAAPALNNAELDSFLANVHDNWSTMSAKARSQIRDRAAAIQVEAEKIANNNNIDFAARKEQISELIESRYQDLQMRKPELEAKVDSMQSKVADFIKDSRAKAQAKADQFDVDDILGWVEAKIEGNNELQSALNEAKEYASEKGITSLNGEEMKDAAKDAAEEGLDMISALLEKYANE